MTKTLSCMLTTLVLLTMYLPVSAAKAPAKPKLDLDTRIDIAIEKGVNFLRKQIQDDPWSKRKKDKYVMGRPAIEAYALLKSDVALYDPVLQKAMKALEKIPPRQTYGVSLYVMMLDAALSQLETDKALLQGKPDAKVRVAGSAAGRLYKRILECHNWLLNTRRKGRGVWDYPSNNRNRYDNSCTQFAILGLGVTAKRGLKVPADLWMNVAKHFVTNQQKDGPKVDMNLTFARPEGSGRTSVKEKNSIEERPPTIRARGWGYDAPNKGVRLTMTAAGLSSLILARDYLFRNPRYPVQEKLKINQAIWDGAAWLSRDGLKYSNWYYYGLYSVEKVGDLGGMEKIGKIDWYKHGAELILKQQQGDGSWGKKDNHDHNRRYQTAFALLFLNRATDLLIHSRPLILTGKGSGDGGKREGWLYVRRLRGEISARRFFRKLRFHPDPGMHRIAKDLVKDTLATGRAHEVIPHLINLSTSPFKSVVSLAKSSLEIITGEAYEDISRYKAWIKDWEFVVNAALKYNKKAIPKLRAMFRETKSPVLKDKIIWSFEKLHSLEPMEELLAELESDNAEARGRAYRAIKYITGQRLPFDANASLSKRKGQVDDWRSWYEKNKK